ERPALRWILNPRLPLRDRRPRLRRQRPSAPDAVGPHVLLPIVVAEFHGRGGGRPRAARRARLHRGAPGDLGAHRAAQEADAVRVNGDGFVPRMPFGKHRGVLLSELPDYYSTWLGDKLSEWREPLRSAVAAELERRKAAPAHVSNTAAPIGD